MELKEFQAELESFQQRNLAALEAQRNEWKARYDELKSIGADTPEIKASVERAIKRLDAVETQLNNPLGAQPSPFTLKTLGQTVAEAEGLKEFASMMRSGDGKSGYRKGSTFSVPFKSLLWQPEEKTTITSGAVGSSTSGILEAQRRPGIVMPGIRRVRIRDLFPRFPTGNNAVEYVKENAYTNNASPQVEGSAKSESALTFTIERALVKTIAHWIPATRQVLDDFAQLQAYIDQRLLDGLKDEEDQQLWRGDGTGENLEGFTAIATAYDTSLNDTGDTRIDKVLNAISQVESYKLTPTGVIINPKDWRKMQKTKETGASGTGAYVMGGPKGNDAPMLWGLPVATSHEVTLGTFGVGAFETHSAIWDRMEARIDVSTEHSDFFTRNMVAIRAEERLAVAFYRDDAFVYGAF